VSANYRIIATQVGDLVKWDSSVNEIGRAASAILGVSKDSFPNGSITSVRAQLVYDWILSLARAQRTQTNAIGALFNSARLSSRRNKLRL
jgi:hypothetical protein